MKPRPTALSLYSGAGGLDAGFRDANFDLRFANDNDRWAVETYKANLGGHAIYGDVLTTPLPDDLRPTVVIGGPPCQGFSVIGRMDPKDERSVHVDYFLHVVDHYRPDAFVMENVKALGASPRWETLRKSLLRRAREELGYATEIYVLNATHYGVPQARERMFMIGVRDGEPVEPEAISEGNPPTVRSALSQLPRYGEKGNNTASPARVVPAAKPVMRPTPHKGSLLFNGSGRPLDLDSPAKTIPASMGGNATPIIDQDELDGTAEEPWVIEYHAHLLAGGEPLKQAPKRMRRITVEEAAALQTFEPGWEFKGPLAARYRQVGNAVPPRLAYHVALAVRKAIATARQSQSHRRAA
jgi:DNA (cytosine-5)-methyltransferase 1